MLDVLIDTEKVIKEYDKEIENLLTDEEDLAKDTYDALNFSVALKRRLEKLHLFIRRRIFQ